MALTKQVVDYAHQFDVTVEGELGVLAGVEDEVSAEHHTYTDPKDVVDFVSKTGVDSLAISIGTSHGANKFKPEQCTRNAEGILVPPELRFDILAEIEKELPGFPIVLHGSSSVPQEYVKIINTHGGALKDAVGIPEEQLPQGRQERRLQDQHRLGRPSGDDRSHPQDLRRPARRVRPRKYLGPARDELKKLYMHKCESVLGSAGKGLIRNIPTKKPGLSRPGFFRFRRALPENGGSGEKSRKGAEFRTQSDAETSDIPRSGRDRTESLD